MKKVVLHIKNLNQSYQKQQQVIKNLDLLLYEGAMVSLVGESGSGKTTLARLIAGLEIPDSGTIELNGKMVSGNGHFTPPEERRVGMVFQSYALFPHLSVEKNVAYGVSKEQNVKAIVEEALELVGLLEYRNRYPHQLSGGQQQRVALARTIAAKPKILILDEPFSNLDTSLKLQLRNEIFDILKNIQCTVVFITHDTNDAMAISDTIAILKDGQLQQMGTPKKVYEQPSNEYVAAMFGTIVRLSIEDLSYFEFQAKENRQYAIRMDKLQSKANSSYKAKVFVVKSSFLGNHYLNIGVLPNKTKINFITSEAVSGEFTLGFEHASILEFEDNQK